MERGNLINLILPTKERRKVYAF